MVDTWPGSDHPNGTDPVYDPAWTRISPFDPDLPGGDDAETSDTARHVHETDDEEAGGGLTGVRGLVNLGDYSRTPAGKGWGPGWPTSRAADMARVTADRSGVGVNVHRRIARLMDTLLDAMEHNGYLCIGGQTGAYNSRPISGTQTPSNHSWGLAIDINWRVNFASYDGRNHGDLPDWVVRMFARYGFAWGGNYRGAFKDPMHFEFMGTPADADDMTALAVDELRETAAKPRPTEEDDDLSAEVLDERQPVPADLKQAYEKGHPGYSVVRLAYGNNVLLGQLKKQVVAQTRVLERLTGLLADGNTVQPDELRAILREELAAALPDDEPTEAAA